MDDIQELIKNVAVRIAEHDMAEDLLHCQRRQWGNYIQNPLPIDSVTASSPIFYTQLMKTVGNASHRFEEQLNAISSSVQDRGVLCAAAASGMGKTHIAYDVGKKHFLILIRVMGNSGEFNGDQLSNKSPPWDSALEHMKQFKARSLAEPLIQRAKGMLRYIHILLYTYLQFTISALNAVALDSERRKELVLRLHRSGVADELIQKLFVRNVQQLTNVDTHGICERKFCSFRQEVIDSSWDRIPATEKLIFCVDEINGLAGDFFTDFVPRSTVDNAENFEDGGEPECRGLMHALFCVLKKISTTHPSWYGYVTGTALSVAKFQSDVDGISIARGSILPVSPDTLLSVDDMVSILTYYFRFTDAAIALLRGKLADFTGRPQFFVKGVFDPLYNFLPRSAHHIYELDSAMFNEFKWIESNFSMLAKQYFDKYSNMFGPEARSLPNGVKNMKAMLPSIVCAYLSGGVYNVNGDDVLEGAVYTGILPMGVKAANEDRNYQIDLRREPIIYNAIARLICSLVRRDDGVSRLLSMMTDLGGEKGKLTEWIFCMFVILQVQKMHLEHKRLDLRSLFEVLTESSHHDYLEESFAEYEVLCSNIVDMGGTHHSSTKARESFLRTFVKPNNEYDFHSLLINIDNFAGVDVAFMVKPVVDLEHAVSPRLVVFQVKNRKVDSLDSCLLTLSPGCQYLTNEERSKVVDAFYTGTSIKCPANQGALVGFGKILQTDHVKVCSAHPVLATQWIRVCLVARPVTEALLKLMADLRQGNNPSTWSSLMRGEKKLKKIAQSLDNNQLVLLSMSSSSYLLRCGQVNLLGDVTSAMSKPKKYRKWISVTTDDVANLFRK